MVVFIPLSDAMSELTRHGEATFLPSGIRLHCHQNVAGTCPNWWPRATMFAVLLGDSCPGPPRIHRQGNGQDICQDGQASTLQETSPWRWKIPPNVHHFPNGTPLVFNTSNYLIHVYIHTHTHIYIHKYIYIYIYVCRLSKSTIIVRVPPISAGEVSILVASNPISDGIFRAPPPWPAQLGDQNEERRAVAEMMTVRWRWVMTRQ